MKIGWPLSLTKRSGIPKLADISIVVSRVTFGIIFTLSHFEWLSTKTINILFMVFMNGPAKSTCTLCQGVLGLLGQSHGCKGAFGGLLQNRTTTCTRYVLVRLPHMNPTPPCARCPGDLRVKFVKIPLSLALAMVEEWLRAFPTKDNSLRPSVRDICWNTALAYWLIYLLGWPSVMSKYTPTLLTKLDRRVSLYERTCLTEDKDSSCTRSISWISSFLLRTWSLNGNLDKQSAFVCLSVDRYSISYW